MAATNPRKRNVRRARKSNNANRSRANKKSAKKSRGVRNRPRSNQRNAPNVAAQPQRTRVQRKKVSTKHFESPSECVEPLLAPGPRYGSNLDLDIMHAFANLLVFQVLGRTTMEDYIKRTAGTTINEVVLKACFIKCLYYYCVKVGSLYNLAGTQETFYFTPPPDNFAVPTAWAKFMQLFAPYKDPDTGIIVQKQFLTPNAQFNLSQSSFATGVATSDMAHTPSDFAWLRTPRWTSGQEVTFAVDAQAMNWGTVDTRIGLMDGIIRSSGLPFVEYKDIPEFAFDATGVCNITGGGNYGAFVACPCRKYDAEFAAMTANYNASVSSDTVHGFFQPIPVLPLPVAVTGTTWNLKYIAAGLSTLSLCQFRPGRMKQVLRSHPASGTSGGRVLRSLFPVARVINWRVPARLAHTAAVQLLTDKMDDDAFNAAMSNNTGGAPGTVELGDLYYAIMTYFQAAMLSRLFYVSSSLNVLQGTNDVEPIHHLFLTGTKWLGVPLPVAILDFLREMGTTIYGGKAVLPLTLLGDVATPGTPMLASGAEYLVMSVNRDFGSGPTNFAGVFPAQRTTATITDYLVNGVALNATIGGYNGTTITPPLIPISLTVLFQRQLAAFKLTSQFLEEEIPLLGGNTMLMSVDESDSAGILTDDLVYGLGTGATTYLTLSEYFVYEGILSIVPMSREDCGRALVLCPFLGLSGETYMLTGAGNYDVNVDPFEVLSDLIEVSLASDDSIFAKKIAFMAAEKGDMLHAIRSALGPIYGNMVPEDPFLADGCDANWRKTVWNMLNVSAAPYHRINAKDFSRFNSPSFYQKVFKGIKKMPKTFHEGYRKFVDFAGKELPGDLNSAMGAWGTLFNEQSKNVNNLMGTAKLISAAMV